jgi:hypothetical protein
MARFPASAIALALVLGLSASFVLSVDAGTLIDRYQQCGGKGDGCKNRKDACVDAVWPGVQCKAQSETDSPECVRQNEWFWMCMPTEESNSASPSSTIALYGQCGGKGAECKKFSEAACADAQFPDHQCAEGSTCQRKEEHYWQVRQHFGQSWAQATCLPSWGQR